MISAFESNRNDSGTDDRNRIGNLSMPVVLQIFQDVPREEANFLRDVLKMKIDIPERGGVNMCKGLEDWIAEEREAGRAEGRAEVQSEIRELKARLKEAKARAKEAEVRADRLEKALKNKNMLV